MNINPIEPIHTMVLTITLRHILNIPTTSMAAKFGYKCCVGEGK